MPQGTPLGDYSLSFETGKEVSVTRAAPGGVKRLSVAVLLDENNTGNGAGSMLEIAIAAGGSKTYTPSDVINGTVHNTVTATGGSINGGVLFGYELTGELDDTTITGNAVTASSGPATPLPDRPASACRAALLPRRWHDRR